MIDAELNVLPSMADNMRVSSDGLTYLFRLREGVRWSDGEPLTADDFAFTWMRMRELETRTAFLMEDVETAEALDDRTLEITLREPRSFFPYVLASPWAFPWPRHRCEQLGEDWHRPENLVSNGPFTLAEFDDEHALLTANPHWNGPRGNVREIEIPFIETSREMIERWTAGEFDVLTVWNLGITEAPDTLYELIPDLHTRYVGFCVDKPPFSNEHVRKAFSHAVNREAAPTRMSTASAPRPEAARFRRRCRATPTASGRSTTRRPRASSWRTRATPKGAAFPSCSMLVPPWLMPTAKLLAEQVAEIGFRVDYRAADGKFWSASLENEHLWVSGFGADYPDPDGFFRGLFREPFPFYRDDEIEEKIIEARSLGNQPERMKLYHEIDRLWVSEHAAVLPIAYGRSVAARRPWIDGFWANPLSKASLDRRGRGTALRRRAGSRGAGGRPESVADRPARSSSSGGRSAPRARPWR